MNKKRIVVAICVLSAMLAITFMTKQFFASSISRSELASIYFHATIYDQNGEKVYLGSEDEVSLFNNDGEVECTIENGSINAMVPLYEFDEENSGQITKRVKIDNNSHTLMINENTVPISPKEWMFQAEKDDKNLEVYMPSYTLTISGYNGYIVSWNISREMEQSFETEDFSETISITTEDLYESTEYDMLYGDSSIVRYTAPCNYRSADVYEDSEGYYIEFKSDENMAFSIADGEVIKVDDVNETVAVKYNDGIFIIYGNVSPAVSEEEYINKGDVIGFINETLKLRTCNNGDWVASEWLYDDYERPEEGPNCPRMYQTDLQWSSRTYGYNTIGGGGCGPSSIAMAASGLLGRVYTPEDIVDIIESYGGGIWYYAKGEGSTYAIFPRVADKIGLEIDEMETSEEAIKEKLEEGKMVIISISAGRYYHGEGHFILIRGLDSNGNFLINDSSSSFDLNTGYDYSDIKPIKSARAIYKPE